jgi:Ca2+-binding RTX toxin-like protein
VHYGGSGSYVLGKNVERLLLQGGVASGIGNELDNSIFGNGLANLLDGRAGADVLIGGKGDDTYIVDNAADGIDESQLNGDGIDVVRSTVNFSLANPNVVGDVENLILQGKALTGTGNGLNNQITGNAGKNSLAGLDGDDTLNGGAGNDTIRGGAGDDTIDGGAGADLLDLSDGTAGITFILTNGSSNTTVNLSVIGLSTATGDTYRNMEGVIGTNFNDTLVGSANADTLTGGGGTDIMKGNAVIDTVEDTFKFNATSESSTTLALSDVINEFVHGTDKIDLSAIDADTGIGGDQAFLFGGNNASAVANSVTWFESGGGNTILQIDNNGDTTADMQIVLAAAGVVSDADFIL